MTPAEKAADVQQAWLGADILRSKLLFVEKNWPGRAREDPWYMNRNDVGDHVREVHFHRKRLGLDKQVICKLMKLLHNRMQVVQKLCELEQPL